MIVAAYLAAIVVANLAVSHFGQAALLATATVLIPFDLASRDILHDRWSKQGSLILRMGALVLTGSLVTALLNIGAWKIAAASASSFAIAAAIDAVVYELSGSRSRLWRMNASNAASAVADSTVFPLIAFGLAANPALCISQAALKFAGGAVWSAILARYFFTEAKR